MIKVFGHPRSGNHLLASLLHKAFYPDLEPLVMTNKNTGHWTKRHTPARYCVEGKDQGEGVLEIPYGKLMGTHGFPDTVADRSQAIYIMRDGRDVAVSVWGWKKFHHKRLDPSISLEDYLRTPIDWRGSPGRIGRVKDDYLLFDHWRDHVNAWVETDALCIHYEDLTLDPNFVIECIADYFCLKAAGEVTLPGPVGWNPSEGKPRVGAWREQFSDALKDLFDEKVPGDHPGLWKPEV